MGFFHRSVLQSEPLVNHHRTGPTSSVDQQHHLSLFGVFLQDSLDLRRKHTHGYYLC